MQELKGLVFDEAGVANGDWFKVKRDCDVLINVTGTATIDIELSDDENATKTLIVPLVEGLTTSGLYGPVPRSMYFRVVTKAGTTGTVRASAADVIYAAGEQMVYT